MIVIGGILLKNSFDCGAVSLLAKGVSLGDEASATVTPTATESSVSSSVTWEYRLRCTQAPTDLLAGTPLGDIGGGLGYRYGYYNSNSSIDPDGPGYDAKVRVGIGANGSKPGDKGQSMTVTAVALAKWENEWTVLGQTYDTNEGPVYATDERTISLVSPYSPTLTKNPASPVQSVQGSGNLKSLVIVQEAFSVHAIAAYLNSGTGETSVTAGPFTYATSNADDTYAVGPETLDWTIVLEKREYGTSDPWAPVDPQPDWG
ncbi:hypothetical protein JIN85_18720 [Luteolibacter pohnpeiensis]|uniref:Uncharacterized protein n=1 Tax=Luteolibacter pohnpeiensis TaxID=454153 RepID=A0A934SE51_9BACT|nr:hypothetical protein [Luteolibacter pohnpeiensis]MBK1884457.1 hypothetical protein [Luteolibacter pohnpeiensis]